LPALWLTILYFAVLVRRFINLSDDELVEVETGGRGIPNRWEGQSKQVGGTLQTGGRSIPNRWEGQSKQVGGTIKTGGRDIPNR